MPDLVTDREALARMLANGGIDGNDPLGAVQRPHQRAVETVRLDFPDAKADPAGDDSQIRHTADRKPVREYFRELLNRVHCPPPPSSPASPPPRAVPAAARPCRIYRSTDDN